MWRFLAKRIGMGGLTVFATTIAVTLLIHLVPGDPVQIMYAQSQGTTPSRHRGDPARPRPRSADLLQYMHFSAGCVHGDLGYTIRGHQPVLDVILERLPNTLVLAGAAMTLAIASACRSAFLAAYRRGTVSTPA